MEKERKLNDATVDEKPKYLPWKFCEKCDLKTPPRSHHCTVCDQCILKRDHHCFFVAQCIGHFNQRYFAILMFYTGISGLIYAYISFSFLSNHFFPTSEWSDL